jgi:CRP-like cAMP-binding protein
MIYNVTTPRKGNNPFPQDDPFCHWARGADKLAIVRRKNPEGDRHSGTAAGRPPLFAGISPGDYAKIAAGARVKEFKRGEVLYMEGESVRQVLLLTSGSVKMTKVGLSGDEVLLRFSVPGCVLGAASLFTAGKHCSTAQAFRLCRALVWEAPAFKTLMERFPLHQNMTKILSQKLLDLEERFREVATEKVGPRVARQVMRLMEHIGQPVDDGVEIGLSRENLAQMTGTTLFSVSRLLSAWQSRGIVRLGREVATICDVPSLRAIAKGDESLCSARPASGRKPLYQKGFRSHG